MNKNEIQEKILSSEITELRRTYDLHVTMYNSIRTKILTFAAAGFALLTYLYGTGESDIKLPAQQYGIILFLIGLACVIIAISTLLYATSPVLWLYPTSIDEEKPPKFATYLEYLKDTKSEYLEAVRGNRRHCEKKQKHLFFAFPLLVIGAILLIVISRFH